MEFICHRINTIEELSNIPAQYGVEIDLRDECGELVLTHDPFVSGEKFEDYLKVYHHGTMILNIKSERIEHRVVELLRKYEITDYFFLDSSFPMIYLLSNSGERKIALRYSEFEGMDTIRNMSGLVEWIWVDCFTKFPLDFNTYNEMKSLGYKLCLVSPELQSRPEDLSLYNDICKKNEITFDAICTKHKNITLWD